MAERPAGRRIVKAEAYTGGMVATRLIDRAGSLAYVAGSVVSYANKAKIDLLDVPAVKIAEHGAVSEQAAVPMTEGHCVDWVRTSPFSLAVSQGPKEVPEGSQ